jgi:hypothetical protein
MPEIKKVHENSQRDAVSFCIEVYGYFKDLQVNERKFFFVYPLNPNLQSLILLVVVRGGIQ